MYFSQIVAASTFAFSLLVSAAPAPTVVLERTVSENSQQPYLSRLTVKYSAWIPPTIHNGISRRDTPWINRDGGVLKQWSSTTVNTGSSNFLSDDSDINKGFRGYFSYLVPEWTGDKTQCATSIKAIHQANPLPYANDLALGAGGDYRYVLTENIPGQNCLTVVDLLRSKTAVSQVPNASRSQGYKWLTADINEGRGGDYLYVIFGNMVNI